MAEAERDLADLIDSLVAVNGLGLDLSIENGVDAGIQLCKNRRLRDWNVVRPEYELDLWRERDEFLDGS